MKLINFKIQQVGQESLQGLIELDLHHQLMEELGKKYLRVAQRGVDGPVFNQRFLVLQGVERVLMGARDRLKTSTRIKNRIRKWFNV
jgi:hypothetical protein